MSAPELLVIHIMKTAGTSLRGMLQDGAGPDVVYPNDDDLRQLPRGWYPGPAELVEQVRSGRAGTPRAVIGHIPYALVDEFAPRPRTLALLRDPVARTVSMMDHRRTRSKRYRGASYAELLDDEAFVARQVLDYQTKVFAFDSVEECPENVNVPLHIDDARFERALRRLEAVDVLGVVEDLPAFTARLRSVTGIVAGAERTANRASGEREPLNPDIRSRVEELTARDAVLYRRAQELVAAQRGRRRPRWSRWSRKRSDRGR